MEGKIEIGDSLAYFLAAKILLSSPSFDLNSLGRNHSSALIVVTNAFNSPDNGYTVKVISGVHYEFLFYLLVYVAAVDMRNDTIVSL